MLSLYLLYSILPCLSSHFIKQNSRKTFECYLTIVEFYDKMKNESIPKAVGGSFRLPHILWCREVIKWIIMLHGLNLFRWGSSSFHFQRFYTLFSITITKRNNHPSDQTWAVIFIIIPVGADRRTVSSLWFYYITFYLICQGFCPALT